MSASTNDDDDISLRYDLLRYPYEDDDVYPILENHDFDFWYEIHESEDEQ